MRRIFILIVIALLLSTTSVMGQGARVSYMWPFGGPNSQSVTAYVYGDSFAVAPPSVRLIRSGYPDLVGGSVNIVSQRYLTCVFDLTGRTAGLHDLSVTNTFGGDTLPGCFTVYSLPDLPPVWERTSVGFGGSYMNGVAVGDGDGDGAIDVFGANNDGSIYRFEWNGLSWTKTTVGSASGLMYAVAVGDGNDDGEMEVYGASGDSTLYQFKWNGSGWTKTTVGGGGWHMYGLAVGDGNWDTQFEVYGANGDSVLYEYKWNGLSWDETVVGTGDWFMYAVAVGDGNGDQEMEVYGANTDSSVYQFKWNGATWAKTVVVTAWGPMLGVAVGDGNGDGEQEVYSASQDGNVYQSKWNGLSWDVTTVGSGSSGMFGVAVGDGDGDGLPEVYCANLDDSLYSFEWDSGGWTPRTLGAGTGDMSGVAMGDGNNDGKMEVYGADWDNIIYQFRPISSPDIDLSDTLYDFGPVPIGDSLDWESLVVRNVGTGTLVIGGIVSDNVAYTVVFPPFADTILPQDSSQVTVRFKPQVEGAIPGTLTVFSNDPDESPIYIGVDGEGYLPGVEETTSHLRVFSVRPAQNPGVGEITFYVDTPCRGHVTLDIFDVAGRLVETVLTRDLGVGSHRAACEMEASSGIYFYRAASPWGTVFGRVVLLR